MPSDKYDLIGRVKAVEREYTALRFTTDRVLRSLDEGGVDLEEDLKRLDVNRSDITNGELENLKNWANLTVQEEFFHAYHTNY